MSLPPISFRPAFPVSYPPLSRPISHPLPQGILLAQAEEGPLPTPQQAKLELLGRDEFLQQSVPQNIEPPQPKDSFSDAQDINDYLLTESGLGVEMTLDGKSIGKKIIEDKAIKKGLVENIIQALEKHWQARVIKVPRRNNRILNGVKEFIDLNQKAHAEINFWQRLRKMNESKIPQTDSLLMESLADDLLMARIETLQDILYQSYQNVAGSLLRADPSGLSDEQAIFHARLMLVTGKPLTGKEEDDNKIANDYFQSRVKKPRETPTEQLKQLLVAIRGDLARNWYHEVGAPFPPEEESSFREEPEAEVKEEDDLDRVVREFHEQVQGRAKAQPTQEVEARPSPQPTRGVSEKRMAVRARVKIVQQVDTEDLEIEMPSGYSRPMELWGGIGLLGSNRFWKRPPLIGKRHSGRSLDLRKEVTAQSQPNDSDFESKGALVSGTLNFHPPLAEYWWPLGSLFVMGGVEGGYAGRYDGQSVVMIDLHAGAGLNLVSLFHPNPDFDLVVRTVPLHGGFNNFMSDYLQLGFGQYGGCVRFQDWQACLDYSQLSKTAETEDSNRAGPETKELNLILFSLGYFASGL